MFASVCVGALQGGGPAGGCGAPAAPNLQLWERPRRSSIDAHSPSLAEGASSELSRSRLAGSTRRGIGLEAGSQKLQALARMQRGHSRMGRQRDEGEKGEVVHSHEVARSQRPMCSARSRKEEQLLCLGRRFVQYRPEVSEIGSEVQAQREDPL